MKRINKLSLWLAVLGLAALNSQAQTVIGSWQTGQAEGWYDNGNNNSITDPSNTNKYQFVEAGVPGYLYSLQITDPGGWNTDLSINLNTVGETADLLANDWLTFTFSVPSSATSGATSGFSQIPNVVLNAQGSYNWLPWSDAEFEGDFGANSPEPNFYFWSGVGLQSQTVTINYSSYVASIASGGEGWVEIQFMGNNGSGAPAYYYMNNVVLSTGPFGTDAASPAPTMSIQEAKPGLRVFAGSTVNWYDRSQVDAYNDGDEGWIFPGVNYPVTYSFTLQDFPVAPQMQCQLFLIPESSAGAPLTGNEYVDYNASNELWLTINGLAANPNGSSGYYAEVAWKTNGANTNPGNLALQNGGGVVNGIYTNTGNQSPVGTWTLKFTSATTGTLTPPGVAALPFTIADANAAADFAAPVLACFGLQPQLTSNEGTWIDYASISIAGTANPISENFANEPADITAISGANSSGLWDISDSAVSTSVQLVTTNTPYWVIWTLPDVGWGLGVSPNLPITQTPGYIYGSANSEGSWVLPDQFAGYPDPSAIAPANQGGTNWTLIPTAYLPSAEFPAFKNAYFALVSPPPPN